MNSSNCLLCGKSLGGVRSGGGEDFCSREHRSQYRLCRGMERLTEPNQITTVIRSREMPKLFGQPLGGAVRVPRIAEPDGMFSPRGSRPPVLRRLFAGPATNPPSSGGFREITAVRSTVVEPCGFQLLRPSLQTKYSSRAIQIGSRSTARIKSARPAASVKPFVKKGLTPRVPLRVMFSAPRIASWEFRGTIVPALQPNWQVLSKRPAAADIDSVVCVHAVPAAGSSRTATHEFLIRGKMERARPCVRPIFARIVAGPAAARTASVVPGNSVAHVTPGLKLQRVTLPTTFVLPAACPAPFAAVHRISAAPFVSQDQTYLAPVQE